MSKCKLTCGLLHIAKFPPPRVAPVFIPAGHKMPVSSQFHRGVGLWDVVICARPSARGGQGISLVHVASAVTSPGGIEGPLRLKGTLDISSGHTVPLSVWATICMLTSGHMSFPSVQGAWDTAQPVPHSAASSDRPCSRKAFLTRRAQV